MSFELQMIDGEPVFVKAWTPSASNPISKALGHAIRAGIKIHMNAVRGMNSRQSFGSSPKGFAASRHAHQMSKATLGSKTHYAAEFAHRQAAKANAGEAGVAGFHNAMAKYHHSAMSGGKVSAGHIAEEKAAPKSVGSHLEAANIHQGLAAAHEKLGNKADAAFHNSMSLSHMNAHLGNTGATGVSASWQLVEGENEPMFVQAELTSYTPRSRQAGIQKRKFLSKVRKQYGDLPSDKLLALHKSMDDDHPDLSGVIAEMRKRKMMASEPNLDSIFLKAGQHEDAFMAQKGSGFPAQDRYGNKFGGLSLSEATEKAKLHDLASHSASTPAEFTAHQASRLAYHASENAFSRNPGDDEVGLHKKAEDAHAKASRLQRPLGNWKAAQEHEAHTAGHATMVSNLNNASFQQTPSRRNLDWRGGFHED